MLFADAYYFWAVSYWAFIFIVLFAFVNMEQLKKVQYVSLLLISVVFCVSRIYHILFIPMGIITLLMLGKSKGRRFRIYCYTVISASAFEGIYSLFVGGSLTYGNSILTNILDIGLFRIIENTFYYEVQVITSFLGGEVQEAGIFLNIIGILIVFSLISFVSYVLLWKKKEWKVYACIVLNLGILSLGSIAITVITCGSYANVQFPHNYATAVNWKERYYQKADLHFSYAYMCFFIILFVIFFLIKKILLRRITKYKVNKKSIKLLVNSLIIVCIGICALLIETHLKERKNVYDFSGADWSVYYEEINKDSFFIPVNVVYRVAQFSMQHNSKTVIYGIDENGEGSIWNEGAPVYMFEKPYSFALLGAVSDFEKEKVISITAKRAIINFDMNYVAVLKGKNGDEITRITSKNNKERIWIDFLLEEPVSGIYSIEFYTEDGNTAYIKDGLQIGVVDYDESEG